jgi:hypothetical protein
VTLPANHRRLAVRNATTGGFAVTVAYPGAGSNVAVAPDTTALLQGDGVDLFGVAGGGAGGGASALDELTDVDASGAINGDLLRFDGSLWSPDAGGVHTRIPLPFKGALLQRSTDLTSVSFPVLVPFENTVYDTDAFWNAGNPSRLTIPAGVTKVRLQGSLALKAGASSGGVYVAFRKNDVGDTIGGGVFTVRQGTSGYTNNDFTAATAVIPVTEGDFFELRVNSTTSSWDDILASARTWFALEVVETADAANPPYDFSWRKEGQPGASEVVLRQVLARRVMLEADFAGSAGLAGTGATADADFDVQRNGVSIGTIRFEVGATAPTLIAAAAVTLEIGDELIIVAPASVDASLADVTVTFAGIVVHETP